ncbi:MAG: hypothetical protein NC918_02905 [Candidatus Omnitrophica bacterium]|nr:hypothetical protein [Candidatus Omnitrophota bacterium]
MQEQEVGKITHYFGKISVGIIKLIAPLKVGDTIHIKGRHDDFTQQVTSIQVQHAEVQEAKAGDEVGIKVISKVHENDIVYKLAE